MNGVHETKSEIRARIEEIQKIREEFWGITANQIEDTIERRLKQLREELEVAEEDLSSSILRSHTAVCKAKNMSEKAAYGNDPAVFYSMAVSAESGELLNKIVKAQRDGNNKQKVFEAVLSELPDVIIYSFILAHVLDINLLKLVSEKVEIVIDRANKGYYGGPLAPGTPGSLFKV